MDVYMHNSGEFRGCRHNNENIQIAAFPMRWTYVELFYSLHQHAVDRLKTLVSTEKNGNNCYIYFILLRTVLGYNLNFVRLCM